jgi:hypothetical protein
LKYSTLPENGVVFIKTIFGCAITKRSSLRYYYWSSDKSNFCSSN